MKSLLFLTACVNPKGMAYTKLSSPEVRLQQYKAALDWYLENTGFQILLVENSHWDFSAGYKAYIDSGRLEFLTFDGNDYDRSRGKGYGEAAIMEYGIAHSRLLKTAPPNLLIVKVTGRLICRNINELCRCQYGGSVYANIAKDDWGGNISTSQFVIAPLSFWREYFLPNREDLDDSKCYHFEHLLYDSIVKWRKDGKRFREFWNVPMMEGVSGTSGAVIKTTQTLFQKIIYRLMYLLHRLGYRGYLNPFYHGLPKKPIEV